MKEKLKRYAHGKFRRYPKTREITELRDELYSMMCDKYDDCVAQGVSEEESYKRAVALMKDCKGAVREVEVGSSLSALRRRLVNLLAFSAVYFITLTSIYLYLSLVTFGSFARTWLLVVGGGFLYLIFFAAAMFGYAKVFDMPRLSRLSLIGLFASAVPTVYLLPTVLLSVLYGRNSWGHSWLVVPMIVLVYVAADLLMFGKNGSARAFGAELAAGGFVLSTVIYLTASYMYGAWNLAWLVYVIYLAVVAFVIYIAELRKNALAEKQGSDKQRLNR